MTRTTTITFADDGVDLDVDFNIYGDEVQIEAIRICGTRMSIIDLVSNKALGRIGDLIVEQEGKPND